MSEDLSTSIGKPVEPGILLLRYIQKFSLLMLAVFSVGSWYIVNGLFALSVLVGGAMAIGSFFLLKNDIEQVINKVGGAGSRMKTVRTAEKIRFFVKFYARLIVLGLLMFVLVTKVNINMIGLAVGLSTIMSSVIIVILSKGRTIYSVQSFKGA
ncbi:MAG: hypothetical protein GQ559_01195 [Desulfobulbaceae bacterium]|nr:hypothetical protein [Desulfobulbaceae bacterium]